LAEAYETTTDLIMDTPFHSVLNWYHSISDQASEEGAVLAVNWHS